MNAKLIGTLAALCLIAACSTAEDEVTTPPLLRAFGDIETDARSLIARYVDDNGQPGAGMVRATTTQIPDTGAVQYRGQFLGGISGGTLVGDIALDVQFMDNTVAGTGTNFVHQTDGALVGTLTGVGTVNQAVEVGIPQVALVLDGQITRGGTGLATSIALDGDFYPNGSDVVGAIAGPAEGFLGSDNIQNGLFGVQRR